MHLVSSRLPKRVQEICESAVKDPDFDPFVELEYYLHNPHETPVVCIGLDNSDKVVAAGVVYLDGQSANFLIHFTNIRDAKWYSHSIAKKLAIGLRNLDI